MDGYQEIGDSFLMLLIGDQLVIQGIVSVGFVVWNFMFFGGWLSFGVEVLVEFSKWSYDDFFYVQINVFGWSLMVDGEMWELFYVWLFGILNYKVIVNFNLLLLVNGIFVCDGGDGVSVCGSWKMLFQIGWVFS